MSDVLGIFIIAAIVCAAAFIIYLVRLFMDGRRQRAKMHARRVEDAEREEAFSIHAVKRLGDFSVYVPERKEPVGFIQAQPYDDDSTATLPVIEEGK